MALSMRGTIKDQKGTPIAGASVRLVGARELLGGQAGVVRAPAPGGLAWTRSLTGFEGHRWDCWSQFVRESTGMPFNTFMNEVVQQNPVLEADRFRFHGGKHYLLPERVPVPVDLDPTRH